MGAGGAPIAVPLSCFQNVSPNWKTLLFMINFVASMMALPWTGLVDVDKNRSRTAMAWEVSIFG